MSAPSRPWSVRIRTAWAAPLAAAGVVAAIAHLPVTGEHLAEAPYIGALFVALEVASTMLAVGLMLRPSRAVLLGTAGIGGAAVLAFVVSRSIGLPLIEDDIGEWTEPLAVVSVTAELVMLVGGAIALSHRRPGGSSRTSVAASVAAVALLLVGVLATDSAAELETGHPHDRAASTDAPR